MILERMVSIMIEEEILFHLKIITFILLFDFILNKVSYLFSGIKKER
jgi:hypothetical protein